MSKDFDQMWKEKEKIKAEYTVKGVTYQLPESVPAKLILKIMDAEQGAEIKGNVLREMAEALMGQREINEMLENGLTMDELTDLFDWATDQLMPKNREAQRQGKKKKK